MFKDSREQLNADYDYSVEHGHTKLGFAQWALKVHDIKVAEDDTELMFAMRLTGAEVPF